LPADAMPAWLVPGPVITAKLTGTHDIHCIGVLMPCRWVDCDGDLQGTGCETRAGSCLKKFTQVMRATQCGDIWATVRCTFRNIRPDGPLRFSLGLIAFLLKDNERHVVETVGLSL
jgi:hypothetical protein